jgi:hypothetical protein
VENNGRVSRVARGNLTTGKVRSKARIETLGTYQLPQDVKNDSNYRSVYEQQKNETRVYGREKSLCVC